MLAITIGFDGVLESWDELGEQGCGQILIDDIWYQVNEDGEITFEITIQ